MAIPRIANKNAREYVQKQKQFDGSNTYARLYLPTTSTNAPFARPTTLYSVYSYGKHFPLFVAETIDGITHWYENIDKYSVSTSKHKAQLHPHTDTIKLTTQDMRRVSYLGIAGVVVQKEF